MNKPTNSYRDLQPTLFVNKSGETVPAFGVMRVTETDPSTRQALYAQKPDGTNSDCTLWINLEIARPDGKTGFCTRSEGCYVLFDDSDTPAAGEEWGPTDDWKLHKGRSGFVIVGGIKGSGDTARVRVHAASSPPGTLIYGTTTASVADTDATFSIDHIVVVRGTDPRDDPEDDEETLTVANTLALSMESGQTVYAEKAVDGTWETWAGGGTNSTGTDELYHFELAEDLGINDSSARAVLIEIDGTNIEGGTAADWTPSTAVALGARRRATADAGSLKAGDIITSNSARTTGTTFDGTEASNWTATAQNIYVVDADLLHAGFATYDDPQYGTVSAYRGFARKFTSNYNSTGRPGYVIVSMEGQARWIEGEVAKDTDSEDGFTYLAVDKFWGEAPNGRSPKTEEVSGILDEEEELLPVVKVYDTLDPEAEYTKGDRKRAIWDEKNEKYVFAAGGAGGISMAIGEAAEDVLASSEFNGGNWTVTDGPESPASTQEIQNPLGLSVAEDRKIIVAKLGDDWYLLNAACP